MAQKFLSRDFRTKTSAIFVLEHSRTKIFALETKNVHERLSGEEEARNGLERRGRRGYRDV